MSQIILLNKPYNVLPQFSDSNGRPHLGHYVDQPGVYPAGRLDRDSGGLMGGSDDGALQHAIRPPAHTMSRTGRVEAPAAPATASGMTAGSSVLESEAKLVASTVLSAVDRVPLFTAAVSVVESDALAVSGDAASASPPPS